MIKTMTKTVQYPNDTPEETLDSWVERLKLSKDNLVSISDCMTATGHVKVIMRTVVYDDGK